jgi:hypothetical protein
MATQYIQGEGESAGQAATFLTNLKNASVGVAPILYDKIDGALKYYDRVNGVVRQVLGANPAPVSITGALSITAALHVGRALLLNAVAGGALALPAATGSGNTFRFYVGTALTSASWILTATGGVFAGGVFINNTGDSTAATADFYPPAALDNTLTLAFSVGAGVIGDWIEVTDIKSGVYAVRGVIQAETDPATPFSTV